MLLPPNKLPLRAVGPFLFSMAIVLPAWPQDGGAVSSVAGDIVARVQPLPSAPPEQVGLSLNRLQRIDRHIQGYIDRKEASGALALVARRGKIAYFNKWGDADREAGKPIADDTIFRIYSMSKPITTAAVMILLEEGHFFLNDPVAKFLPEFADMQVQTESKDPETGETKVDTKPASRPITIRDLLRHTAGLTYGIFGNTKVDQQYRQAGILVKDFTLAETTEKLGKIPLRFEPGTRWHYSVSVDVAGRLVEVVSGQSFGDFLRERLFDPLGMVDTDFTVPSYKRDRFARLYTPKGTQADSREAFLTAPKSKEIIPMPVSADMGDFDENVVFQSGGGGLVSTAHDYLRFCLMMLGGGELDGKRVLSRKTIEMMTTDHLHGIQGLGNGRSFGLGFGVVTDVGQTGRLGTAGTYDWGGAAGTKFWIDPQEELIGIFMVQILPHQTRMGEEFRELAYQAIID